MTRRAAEILALIFVCTASNALSAQVPMDTVLRVQPGVAIRLDMRDGSLRVGIGAPGQVRVQARGDSSPGALIIVSGDTIAIMSRQTNRRDNVVHYEIAVPPGARLIAAANDADVVINGPLAEATVLAQHGRVEMKGIRGVARVTLFRGSATLRKVTGRVEATSLRGDIEVTDVQGNVIVRNTDGHIHLADIDGDSVTAQSVDGEVAYRGGVRRTGVYLLSTHKEGIRLHLPAGSSATIHGVTVHGVFGRPEQWTLASPRDSSSRRMVVGSGSATVRLSTFRGSIDVSIPK